MDVIESDSSNAMDSSLLAAESPIFNDIICLLHEVGGGVCCYVTRQSNTAAHTLAQFA